VVGPSEYSNAPRIPQSVGICWLHEELLASDEGLCSTEVVNSSANTSSNGSMINEWRPAEDVKVDMAYCNIICRRPSHDT